VLTLIKIQKLSSSLCLFFFPRFFLAVTDALGSSIGSYSLSDLNEGNSSSESF
jgi:hypothetical protein